MSINVNYYGAKSSWVNIPMTSTMTDKFMLGQYANTSQASYGLVSRTWLATKFGMDLSNYQQPIDRTYGYCKTDGGAPFDNILYCTGYNGNYPNRIKTRNKSSSTVGFAGYGNPSAYLTNYYTQYYKSSATGSSTWASVSPNYKPPFQFTPLIDEYSNGVKIMRLSKGAISPALRYDFGNYFIIPVIAFSVLKEEYSITDVNNIENPADYRNLFSASYFSDLRRFYNDVTNNVFNADKIVIYHIAVKAYHISWKEDGTYALTDVSDGKTNSSAACMPIPFFMQDNMTDLTFTDWFTAESQDVYNVKIDTSLISHSFVSSGTVRCYNGMSQSDVSAQINNMSVIAGMRNTYSTLYDNLTSYSPFVLTPCSYGDDNFTVKWFEDKSIPNTQKFAVSVYTTLSAFGSLQGFREYVLRSIAYFGCYFSDCYRPNGTKEWNSSDCFIGTIDDNGVTHGDYTNGTDNDNQRQKEWGDEWSDKTPYNPNKPTHKDENDKGDLNTHLNSGYYVTSAKYYATTEQQITKLIDFINTYAPTDAELTADFKGVNPSDYITNVLFYPFDVNYIGTSSPIYLSVLNTTATGLKFNPSYGITTYDYGGISIDRYFNDFRDFAPYTKLSLNIPFASTVDLDIGEYYGHTLNIKSVIDFTTGDMLFLIMRDALVVKTVSCNCAVQLPFSALAMGTYQQTLNTLKSNANINSIQSHANDIMTITNTGVSMIGAAMSTGATTLISNPLNTIVGGTSQRDILSEQAGQINYAIKHTTPSPITISGGTPCNMSMLEYIPRYTITRCKSLNIIDYNTYGYTVGFATAQQGRLSDFSGFVVCSDIEFDNISATAQEQEMIKNLLKGGVVV
jgi:hypothetical protein